MVIKTLPDPSTKPNGNNRFISPSQRRSQSGLQKLSFSLNFS
jgi:hypothetical protein